MPREMPPSRLRCTQEYSSFTVDSSSTLFGRSPNGFTELQMLLVVAGVMRSTANDVRSTGCFGYSVRAPTNATPVLENSLAPNDTLVLTCFFVAPSRKSILVRSSQSANASSPSVERRSNSRSMAMKCSTPRLSRSSPFSASAAAALPQAPSRFRS